METKQKTKPIKWLVIIIGFLCISAVIYFVVSNYNYYQAKRAQCAEWEAHIDRTDSNDDSIFVKLTSCPKSFWEFLKDKEKYSLDV